MMNEPEPRLVVVDAAIESIETARRVAPRNEKETSLPYRLVPLDPASWTRLAHHPGVNPPPAPGDGSSSASPSSMKLPPY